MSTFITNNKALLKDVITNFLPGSKQLDVLIGYFYFSGFNVLSDSLKDKHIRILVGMNVDITIRKAVREVYSLENNSLSNKEIREEFFEGFCWTDVSITLKARTKGKGIFDVLSMSLFSKTSLADWYYVSLINTVFMSSYVNNFINNTVHFQINDARQLPILIPTQKQLAEFKTIFDQAFKIKKEQFAHRISEEQADKLLKPIQNKLDKMVEELYGI
ncbi:MAG: hypothetical protein Q4Q06_03920 [Bacteroidota bacterium]|nr:hypothetical protein [Bacteroidota bacterium]